MVFPDVIFLGTATTGVPVVFAILGLLVGSFLTVVLARYDSGETVVHGRSRCPRCHAVIRWHDNIPLLSYVLLGGRCRACRGAIGWRYPATEAGTAALWALAGWLYAGPTAADLWHAAVVAVGWSVLLLVAVHDLRTMMVPMVPIWLLSGILVADACVRLWLYGVTGVMGTVAGAAVGWGVLYLLVAVSRETWMGMGDVYIGLVAGAMVGGSAVLPWLTTAFGLGAVVGIVLLATGIRGRRDPVPFGPFLAVATLIVMTCTALYPNVMMLFTPVFAP